MYTIRQPCRVFDPLQKITAVLSAWSERRTTSPLCQEMSIDKRTYDAKIFRGIDVRGALPESDIR